MAQAKTKTGKPITAAQIKRIHTIVHILHIADDNYRACLDSRFGVTSCKDLTVQQAISFIDELEKFATKIQSERLDEQREAAQAKAEAERPKRFDNLDNRPGMASGAQLRKIEAMWQDISIVPDHDARARALRHFIKRVVKVADMRFLTGEDAGKIINALNAMQKRESEPKTTKTPKNAA
jgi:cell division protein ZapA (FtsZ GTPase activity inhibitor)